MENTLAMIKKIKTYCSPAICSIKLDWIYEGRAAVKAKSAPKT
jgi:hypothetical protein